MVITSFEAYLGAIALGAFRGARVGWRREALTATFVLGTVLFLSTGGDLVLAHLFSGVGSGGGVAQAAPLSGGGDGTSQVVAPAITGGSCTNLQAVLGKIVFLVMVPFGYFIGRTQATAPTLTHHRISGLLLGGINGAAIMWYISRAFMPPGQDILIHTPTSIDTGNGLAYVFGIGLVLMLVILFIGSQARKTFAAKK